MCVNTELHRRALHVSLSIKDTGVSDMVVIKISIYTVI